MENKRKGDTVRINEESRIIIDRINNKTNIPLNTFTNNGYEFLGWSENKDAVDPEYLDGDLYAVTGNVILYAVWGKSEEND